MGLRYAETYTVQNLDEGTNTKFTDRAEALDTARVYVGNNSFSKPFPGEDTYFFGPGDGTTSVIVRRDIESF